MVKQNKKTYTIWKLEWPEILEGEETYGLARDLTRNLREVDRREILAFTANVEREVQESIDWSYELQYATTKSGNIIAVAEVVRNLTLSDRVKKISSGERRLLDTAKHILASELALASKRELAETEKWLQDLLRRNEAVS